jgi:hypothetical protein
METLIWALLAKPVVMLLLVFVLAVYVYGVRKWMPPGRVKRWLLHPVTGKKERGRSPSQ